LAEVKIRKRDIQEARRPDALLKSATSIFDWLFEHRVAAIGSLVVLLVVVAAISVVQSTRMSKMVSVGGQLSDALALEVRPVSAPKPPPTEGAATPDDKKDDSFATKADREKAVSDALTSVIKEHAGSTSAQSASVMLAAQRFTEGKYDDAISLAEPYVAGGGELKTFAIQTLGNAYAAKSDTAKADAAYKQLADAGEPALSLLLQGSLAEKAGKKDDARKLYEKIVADFEKDPVAKDAHARLDLLDLPAPGVGAIEIPVAPKDPSADDKAPAPKKALKKKTSAPPVQPAGK
jgi:predicted negative regulator of RcsB-dependent stress response